MLHKNFLLPLCFILLGFISGCGNTTVNEQTPEKQVSALSCAPQSQITDFIGKHYSATSVTDPYRIISPKSFVGKDKNPDRLNLYVNRKGIIRVVSCG